MTKATRPDAAQQPVPVKAKAHDRSLETTAKLILVVEDEAEVREALRRGLESAGYAVRTAASRDEALSALDSDAVDLVTLDIGLGTSDGLVFARELRERRNLPVILVTGRDGPSDRVRGRDEVAERGRDAAGAGL